MRILVVGGAGYIGSHMVKQLTRSGHEIVILDNLTTGILSLAIYGKLIVGDLGDVALLERLFREYKFGGVMHFAASSLVGESVSDPSKYYRNNVASTVTLLDGMVRNGPLQPLGSRFTRPLMKCIPRRLSIPMGPPVSG